MRACANGERTSRIYAMPGSLKSSMNLPLPRTRRASSLRTSGLPTQRSCLSADGSTARCWRGSVVGLRRGLPLAARFAKEAFLGMAGLRRRRRRAGIQRRLQRINQLLEVFPGEGLEQAAGHGDDAPEDLRITLPGDLRTTVGWREFEAGGERDVAAGHSALSFILRAARALGGGQFHLHVGDAADVRDADVDPDREVSSVMHRHGLEVGHQGTELLRVGEELVDALGRALDLEAATEAERHQRPPIFAAAATDLKMFW